MFKMDLKFIQLSQNQIISSMIYEYPRLMHLWARDIASSTVWKDQGSSIDDYVCPRVSRFKIIEIFQVRFRFVEAIEAA